MTKTAAISAAILIAQTSADETIRAAYVAFRNTVADMVWRTHNGCLLGTEDAAIATALGVVVASVMEA